MPVSSTSSVGVPTRSVTMAKKRASISAWVAASVSRSVWATGVRPSWSQVRTVWVARLVSSARRVPSGVIRP
jgi:hypothetical protein